MQSFLVVVMLIVAVHLCHVKAKTCIDIAEPKAPYWKGFLPQLMPMDPEQSRSAMIKFSPTPAGKCFGSMNLGKLSLISAFKKTCRSTMSNAFKNVGFLYSSFTHYDEMLQLSQLLLELSAADEDEYASKVGDIRSFAHKLSSSKIDHLCHTLKDGGKNCIVNEFIPILLNKFLPQEGQSNCCSEFVEDFKAKTGRAFNIEFIEKTLNLIDNAMCTKPSDESTCGYDMIQSFTKKKTFVDTVLAANSAATSKDACKMYNGETFALLNKPGFYKLPQALGCCAKPIDQAMAFVKTMKYLSSEVGKNFFSETKSITADQIPLLQDLIKHFPSKLPITTSSKFHFPLGFSKSCSFFNECSAP